MTSTILAGLLLVGPVPSGLVGSYHPDLSLAPKRARCVLSAYFRTALSVSPDGRFRLCGLKQEGFWRLEGDRVTFVLSGFFSKPFTVPDALLRQRTPHSQLEGLVGKLHTDGTIWIEGMGDVEGPIVYRKAAWKPALKLLEESFQEEDEARIDEAYYTLLDDAPNRWNEILGLISSAKTPNRLRGWSTVFLGTPPAGGMEQFLGLMKGLDTSGLEPSQVRYLRHRLAGYVEEHPSPEAVDLVVEWANAGLVTKYHAGRVIGASRSAKHVPLLMDWCREETRDRSGLFGSLGDCADPLALGVLRAGTLDPDPQIQTEAYIGLIKTSTDEEERSRSIRALGGLWEKVSYPSVTILPAWGASKSKVALPYIVNVLETAPDERDRARAAEQLGVLGLPEAVPALLEAKAGKLPKELKDLKTPKTKEEALQALGSLFVAAMDGAEVRKAAIEALWLFDQKAKAVRTDNPQKSGR